MVKDSGAIRTWLFEMHGVFPFLILPRLWLRWKAWHMGLDLREKGKCIFKVRRNRSLALLPSTEQPNLTRYLSLGKGMKTKVSINQLHIRFGSKSYCSSMDDILPCFRARQANLCSDSPVAQDPSPPVILPTLCGLPAAGAPTKAGYHGNKDITEIYGSFTWDRNFHGREWCKSDLLKPYFWKAYFACEN